MSEGGVVGEAGDLVSQAGLRAGEVGEVAGADGSGGSGARSGSILAAYRLRTSAAVETDNSSDSLTRRGPAPASYERSPLPPDRAVPPCPRPASQWIP